MHVADVCSSHMSSKTFGTLFLDRSEPSGRSGGTGIVLVFIARVVTDADEIRRI